jgi:LacI family transcriptional regulator
MSALDYRLNHAAQTLRSRTSRTVGCMLTDVTNPLYANLFRVFEDKFRDAGYMVLLANSLNNPQWEVNILGMFHSRGMDGVIIAPGNERNAKVLAAIEELDIPAVVLDRDMAAHADQVKFDHAKGVKEAVLHLIDLGHRDIALVVAGISNRPMRRRIEGFKAAFAARRLEASVDLIVRLATSTTMAFDEVAALLAARKPPTAIVTLGTNVLGDVLNAIAAAGLRIPADVSVVSMGDPEFARRHVPPIATVAVDVQKAAAESSRLLLERMQGQFRGASRQVMVTTQFIPRGSCAAPRKRRAGD